MQLSVPNRPVIKCLAPCPETRGAGDRPSLPQPSRQASPPSSSKARAINGAISGLSRIRRGSGPSPGTRGVVRELPKLPQHPGTTRLEHGAALGVQENPKKQRDCWVGATSTPSVTWRVPAGTFRGGKGAREGQRLLWGGHRGQKPTPGAGGEGRERSSHPKTLPKSSGGGQRREAPRGQQHELRVWGQ